MLNGPGLFAKNEINEVNFRESFTFAIERCIYFTHKICYTNSSIEIPELPTALEMATGVADGFKFPRLLNRINQNKLLNHLVFNTCNLVIFHVLLVCNRAN